ncbi:hypothetical protein AWB69_07696 [Caballeronia udeis]|uniref:Proteinase inhibitor I42 chagasin domain-containing protein n=1 Tax=Caballeronia udeis TaxID=1232866 RepID=A0A158JF34_9BURK|nr:hypothetical protein AWB69_07696 [Caballeronia udeis]
MKYFPEPRLSQLRLVCAIAWLLITTISYSQTAAVLITRSNQSALVVRLHVGQALTIYTAPAPVTAYHWNFEELANTVVRPVGSPHFVHAGEDAPGIPQRTAFDFLAQSRGGVVLQFHRYIGATFASGRTIDSFAVHVTVD